LYVACTDAACDQNTGSARLAFFSWASTTEKTLRIESNQTIRIKAVAGNAVTGSSTVGGISTVSGSQCVNVFSFVPEAGHTYELYQQLDYTSCRIIISDATTGKPPESFRN
jgi:hypothetical protein